MSYDSLLVDIWALSETIGDLDTFQGFARMIFYQDDQPLYFREGYFNGINIIGFGR